MFVHRQIWKRLGEPFDFSLPRQFAISVKENDYDLSFFYSALESNMAYHYDKTIKSMPTPQSRFKVSFLEDYFLNYLNVCRADRVLLSNQTIYPGLIRSNFKFTTAGLRGTQWFGQKYENSLTWCADLQSMHCFHRFKGTLITVISSDDAFEVSVSNSGVKLTFNDFTAYFTCSRPMKYVGADVRRDLRSAVSSGNFSIPDKPIHELGLCIDFDEAADFSERLVFGFSSVSMENALRALDSSAMEETIAEKYDKWFRSLPVVGNLDERETVAYYKTWAVIRANYYNHPQWGFSITEAYPVYKGIWQAAISAIEWHSDQNPEDGSVWFKKAMDMLCDYQREDGYITHAIYIHEEIPGSGWARHGKGVGTIHQPCLVWSAMRYYHITGDLDSLKKWYPAFKRYHDYITRTRDVNFKNIHLWAILSSFDVGVDTTAVYLRCTYEEDGLTEMYCYPAIYAAERIRFERSMSEIAALLELPLEAEFWMQESEKTHEAAEKYLWDEQKGWYGTLHEDGTLDTRVGIDGLLMPAYGFVAPERAAKMEKSFRRLLGTYGVRSLASDEKGFISDNLWYGPCWPWCLAAGMAAAKNYFSHLADEVYQGILNFIMAHPTTWEAMDVDTGELSHGGYGESITPGTSTNTGAAELFGALWLYRDIPMYDCEMTFPLHEPIRNFHYKGMRITIEPSGDGCMICAAAEEKEEADISFTDGKKTYPLHLRAGEPVCIR